MAKNLVAEWRKNLTTVMTLPSGNTATVKRVSLMDLVRQGDIPDTLSGLVVGLTNQAMPETMSLDELRQYGDVIDLVCKACFVDPPLTDEPSETALGVNEVPFTDKLAVFQWANGMANALKTFRTKQAGAV